MNKELFHQVVPFIAVAAIGFAVGYLISNDSSEVAKLKAELAQRSPLPPSGKGTGTARVWKGAASIPRRGKTGVPAADATAQWPPNELFAKLKITKDDWDKALELNKRRDQGEYILNNERPTTRKFLDYDFTEIVSQAAEKRAPEYDRLFAQLGVSPDIAERLKTHVAKIHRASLEAEVAIDQLLHARRDYDQRLRSGMNEDAYQGYRQYEESKPAVREFQKFQSFAETKNIAIDHRFEQALVGLIQQMQAYTSVSWHGPIDGLPQPIVGVENVIAAEEQQIGQITERANQVLSRSSLASLPDEYKNLLAGYYADRVQEKQRGVEELKTLLAGNAGSQNPARPNGQAH